MKNYVLCEARHNIPNATDGSIFNNTINPLDVNGLEEIAIAKLNGVDEANIYVTGLTVALIAVLNASKITGTKITLWHYNRDTDNYYSQEVKF